MLGLALNITKRKAGPGAPPFQKWGNGLPDSPVLSKDYPHQCVVINSDLTLYLLAHTIKFYTYDSGLPRYVTSYLGGQYPNFKVFKLDAGAWVAQADTSSFTTQDLYQANSDIYAGSSYSTIAFAKTSPPTSKLYPFIEWPLFPPSPRSLANAPSQGIFLDSSGYYRLVCGPACGWYAWENPANTFNLVGIIGYNNPMYPIYTLINGVWTNEQNAYGFPVLEGGRIWSNFDIYTSNGSGVIRWAKNIEASNNVLQKFQQWPTLPQSPVALRDYPFQCVTSKDGEVNLSCASRQIRKTYQGNGTTATSMVATYKLTNGAWVQIWKGSYDGDLVLTDTFLYANQNIRTETGTGVYFAQNV